MTHSYVSPDEYKRALEIVRHHVDDEFGFLSHLRPYRGIRDKQLHEIAQSALAIAAYNADMIALSRESLMHIWQLSRRSREWVLSPTGMLQRNQLVSEDDRSKIEQWTNVLDDVVEGVLLSRVSSSAVSYGYFVLCYGFVPYFREVVLGLLHEQLMDVVDADRGDVERMVIAIAARGEDG